MFKMPLPRIVAGSVIMMVAIAAVLTFTRGEIPAADTASATVPGVSGTSGPVVVGSTTRPKPSSPPSADAAERDAQNADTKSTTKVPAKAPVKSSPTQSPTTSPPKDPEPEPEPAVPAPKPPCGLLTALLGGCK